MATWKPADGHLWKPGDMSSGGGKPRGCTRPRIAYGLRVSMTAHDTHSKTIGYLLWIFGFTGAHRFYYGKPLTGALWFFTFGLLGIGWLLDLFLIPVMDAEADLRYASGRYDYSVAWILQTFLGVFGIHRLYLGKIGTGLIWFLTGGLFGFGWIYDFFTLNAQVNERNLSAC